MTHRLSRYNFDDSLENLPDEGEFDDEEYESIPICNKNGLCTCERSNENTVDCRKGSFGTHKNPLDTANLEIKEKNFLPFRVLLQHNVITTLEKSKIIPNYEKDIVEMDLSYNHIHSLGPYLFSDFKKLKVLKLSHNRITKISPFTGLSSLHKLHLDNNILGTLPKNVFESLKNLNELVLDGNEAINLNNGIFSKGLEKLTILSLDFCELTEIPANAFEKLVSLKQLSLRGNPLLMIPPAIDYIPHLLILDMSETNLPEIERMSLKNNHELEALFMQNMKYVYMINDCAFCNLKNIKKIDFSNSSHLYSININAFGMENDSNLVPQNLSVINFENCNLTTFDSNLLYWENVMSLKISGNPLECDCNLAWLINNKNYHKTFGDKLPICKSPEKFNGTHIHDVVMDKCTLYEKHSIWIRFIVVFLIFCGLIIIWLICSGNLNLIGKRNIEIPEMGYRNLVVTCEDENPFANGEEKEEV
ncbi:Cysteine-rich flanking region, C-terminal domain and Leucine-rich repeat and Leucine-rich repeat, typical subtype and Leucine rich repeat 5-containing protein [Strongyloides ratti]|uniref:Cysteine-rich flanking region, C-terminal domain and Leucine-rich repeat and Leucine-rich repeat, typical subtype and Leucine rich repeat 5-containing protein n=1 Tax=Strongyloides ratti TaxID=34506 RepID=A0A090KTK9_STRRB|nr:Cysteine-rich flanking region, C-terminal domain and Leucine-rich repeat and Leucine-rich repeat, typical subtype and Leucine rich repeat 5-containing protein [Strongyloides ratti]CEF60716.1 Cysteine-rich flanking region, C-terminal domain and Leucine-rich repeat and Leucine-rich repeat, typical subtype and Leucine rich repeat 5-containing protein [Strongyloides ratti]